MNLDVDAPDKVAGVLTAAVTAYQESAVELTAAWQDHQIPKIWSAIASELDLAAWKIEQLVKQRFDQKHSPIRRKKNKPPPVLSTAVEGAGRVRRGTTSPRLIRRPLVCSLNYSKTW
jgi:hypothetical protein